MNTLPTLPATAVRDFDNFWTALRQLLQLPVAPVADNALSAPTLAPLEEALQLSLHRIIEPSRVACDAKTLQRYRESAFYTSFAQQNANIVPPAAVTFPNSEQEIAQLLSWADERELQLLPWGGGASPFQHKQRGATPYIIVDLQHLNRVLEIDTQERWVRAQSGITWTALEESLASHRLTTGQSFAWSTATVGGAAAARSISTKALRYGDLSRNSLAIRALCPAGPVRLLPAHPGAPDERALMLGTFGAWGIITDVTLRLHPSPQERLTLLAEFASWGEAIAALARLRHTDTRLTAARITTTHELALFNNTTSSPIRQLLRSLLGSTPAELQLFLDLEGTREGITVARRQVEELLREKTLQTVGGGREAHLREPDYAQQRSLLQQLRGQRILAHTLTAAVPWRVVTPFLRDWEEALRSIMLTTGGLPGQVLTTLWVTEDYALVRTLLLGLQDEEAVTTQVQDIQAVALATKQRWHVEEPPSPLTSQAMNNVSELLDPNSVMLR